MADYGLTEHGINIKRLDTILEEMHTELSEQWGINTQQNPRSLLNVLLTNIADHIAELWELGQDVYYSQYPTTAEGMYLDNVGQFAGVTRATDAPSYYYVLCSGIDGTVIPSDTIISSTTNPITNLFPVSESVISRDGFNSVVIRVVSIDGNPITIALNGTVYSITPANGAEIKTTLQTLSEEIADSNFTTFVDDDGLLHIVSTLETSNNSLLLSDNLTTESVSSVLLFRTESNGNIYLPTGAITTITKAVTGLLSVKNVGTYIAGQLKESDEDYRKSYVEKIFSHSERMANSIQSAILDNCQGVTAIAVYENDSNIVSAQ